ncbi:ankyrin repeat domain-containing protein [Oceanimonas baumannii]|uniref:Ankyrin repeat domain-containing protein n=1 Tax=Oceanimonas baumannii TaxID=129578 RepID=A0ABY2F033_9GAMM|nr:ankyrin repeat domain-containing protein [Oceanimonas baumannii]TDW59750.1 hypothetical protein LY04_01391 [Oceanimonas baumannii]
MSLARFSIHGFLLGALLMSLMTHAAGGEPEQQLRAAAINGDAPRITALLNAGAQLESRDDNGRTALMLATRHNQVDAAQVLMAFYCLTGMYR